MLMWAGTRLCACMKGSVLLVQAHLCTCVKGWGSACVGAGACMQVQRVCGGECGQGGGLSLWPGLPQSTDMHRQQTRGWGPLD